MNQVMTPNAFIEKYADDELKKCFDEYLSVEDRCGITLEHRTFQLRNEDDYNHSSEFIQAIEQIAADFLEACPNSSLTLDYYGCYSTPWSFACKTIPEYVARICALINENEEGGYTFDSDNKNVPYMLDDWSAFSKMYASTGVQHYDNQTKLVIFEIVFLHYHFGLDDAEMYDDYEFVPEHILKTYMILVENAYMS